MQKNSVRQNLLTQTICGSARCFSRRATESAKLRQNELSMWSAFHHKIYFSYILFLFTTFNLPGRHMKKLLRRTSNAFLQRTWCVSVHDILIVTTFTTPNPENEDGDEDGDVLLRYVVVLVGDVTSFASVDFTAILRRCSGGRRDTKLRCRLRLRLRFQLRSW